ncbi:hypothetical protein [Streptococcus sp. FT1-106]|uniref:hypothetical protein n=1 Tax=unclassified Streptococcus TaxID=2608887 RepID=UPI003BF5FB37
MEKTIGFIQTPKKWLKRPLIFEEYEQLVSLGMTLRKAEYLIDISQKIVIGDISKSYYQTFQTAESAEKAMVKLRGIGPWTANYFLMRCLRMGDAFPMADIGL